MDTSRTSKPAGTLGSPFIEALNAFHARWDLVTRDDIELWAPEAGPDTALIGIARRGAPEESVVDVSLQGDRVWLSASTTGTPIDLAAASRVLRLQAPEVRDVLQAAVEALHYARDAYRLVDELDHAMAAVSFRERELDRAARAGGHDPAWLKNPQAQQARTVELEEQRDRFAVKHGLGGLTASGLDDDYGLAQDVMLLTQERDELADGGLTGWFQWITPPISPVQGLLRPLTTLYRIVHGIVTYHLHTRHVAQDLEVARERRRIAGGLYVAYESLAEAEELHSAHDLVTSLRDEVAANLHSASTPTQRPQVSTPYTARPALGAPHTLEAPTAPGEPGPARPRPETGSPNL
ncbi:hypothetical protein ACFT2C_05135 [Promicromonospora sp. NPDC057138]|uniref:hypothetical protein n=1 Tax=Promicromonospora sp. NPDC057138 TaxID=3346031 RepID=UPI0036387ED2